MVAPEIRRAADRPLLPLLGFLGLLALAFPTSAHAVGGAYAVDDADVDPVGSCAIETWGSFNHRGDWLGVASPMCVVDLGKPVDISAQFLRFRDAGELGAGLNLSAKINLIPSATGALGIGLTGGTAFDLVTGDNVGSYATLLATFPLTDQVSVNLNAGWNHDAAEMRHQLFYGAGLAWNFVEPLTLIAEVYGFTNSGVSEPRFQAGLRYTPYEAVDVDLIFGRNIGGERANWITLGMNLRFAPKAAQSR